MRLPVINGDQAPRLGVCTVCSREGVEEPQEFAYLGGGALRPHERSTSPAFDCLAFLGIGWHGARGETAEIVKEAPSGQFRLSFCSTNCLRTFLNRCVDELEEKLGRS